MFVDTHCHIHEATYSLDIGDVMQRATEAGVTKMICVGTDNQTSEEAVMFAKNHSNVWASLGAHPHDAKDGYENIKRLASERHPEVVAIGEIGLDYFYTHSPREVQIAAFEAQLQLAKDYGLPVIFHVRDAFDDFWPIWRNFSGLRGVLHSFTDSETNMEKGISEGLYISVNGISTFAREKQAMFDRVPLEKMVLETDAPFLTPAPYRGKVNQPAFVRNVAEYHAKRRGVELEHLARVTSTNASALFGI
jgi:TatD DNase family protein